VTQINVAWHLVKADAQTFDDMNPAIVRHSHMHMIVSHVHPTYLSGSKSSQPVLPFPLGNTGLAAMVGCIKPELQPGGGLIPCGCIGGAGVAVAWFVGGAYEYAGTGCIGCGASEIL
jgi:hypothetical protein